MTYVKVTDLTTETISTLVDWRLPQMSDKDPESSFAPDHPTSPYNPPDPPSDPNDPKTPEESPSKPPTPPTTPSP